MGTIVITGTEGRDEVYVVPGGSFSEFEFLIFPFVALTTPPPDFREGPVCQPLRDPLTARAIGHRCTEAADDRLSWQIDLRGGSDALSLSASGLAFESYTVVGGAGDDALLVAGAGPKSLSGGDGDDVLDAPGFAGDPNAKVDGGAGRDLVEYGNGGRVESGEPGGVTANLTTGRAALLISRLPGRPDDVRSDGLTSIERVSGTPFGDILTGGPGPDELLGQRGPDLINGVGGNDTVSGGDGEDRLDGGIGIDSIDGGAGIDEFPKGSGGDTFLMRDGVLEKMSCSARDVVVNDLVDSVDGPGNCQSISTAQAKHLFDTRLSRRVALGAHRTATTRVSCPRTKTEACVGTLRLRLGGAGGPVLARARYRVRAGRAARLSLRLSAREAARTRGRRLTLDATEIDADGRDRRVTAAAQLRRRAR